MIGLTRHIQFVMFILLIALLVLMPIPYGSNRPWALSIAQSTIFFMTTALIFKQLMPIYIATPAPKYIRNILVLFLVSIFYQIIMIMPFPIELIQLVSETRFIHHVSAFPQSTSSYLSLSYDRYTSVKTIVENTSYLALFFSAYHLLDSPRKVTLVLWVIVISGLGQALYGIIEMFDFQNSISNNDFMKSAHTISGSFINRNHFSSYILYAIGATSALLFTLRAPVASKPSKLLDYRFHLKCYLIIFVAALLYSQSRGAEIGLTVSVFIGLGLFLSNKSKKIGKAGAFIISTLPIIIFIYYMASDGWLDRFNYIVDQAPQRLIIWETSLKIFQDYWLTGVGPGNFQYIYPMYQAFGVEYFVDHVHNDYLELLVEQGVIGALLLAAPIIISFITITKFAIRHSHIRMSGTQLSMIVTLTAVLMHAAVDFIFHIPVLVAYFFVLLALALRTFEHNRS